MCLILAFGDVLVLDPRATLEHDEAAFLFGFLGSGASRKIGDILKALRPEAKGGKPKFAPGVPSLPDEPTSQSIRHGRINHLVAHMPEFFAVSTTGHETRSICAIYEYVKALRTFLQPGAVIGAGFSPLPWGHLGEGPKAPSLDVLRSTMTDADQSKLDNMLDDMYHLSVASRRAYRKNGQLRPFLEACLAAQLMYHDERVLNGEFQSVQVVLRESWKRHLGTSTTDTPRFISEAGRLIRKEFQLVNLPLTTRSAAGGMDQVVEAVHSLSGRIDAIGEELSNLRGSNSNLERKVEALDLERKVEGLELQLREILARLNRAGPTQTLTPQRPQRRSSSGHRQSNPLLVGEASPAPPSVGGGDDDAAPTAPAPADAALAATVGGGDDDDPAPATAVLAATRLFAPSSILMRTTNQQPSLEKIDGDAMSFFLLCEQRGGQPNFTGRSKKSLKRRGDLIHAHFSAMATQEERQILQDKSRVPTIVGQQQQILLDLNELVSLHIVHVFNTHSVEVPYSMNKNKGKYPPIKISSIEQRTIELKNTNGSGALEPNTANHTDHLELRRKIAAKTITITHVNKKRKVTPGK
jgi:hypothetical protein